MWRPPGPSTESEASSRPPLTRVAGFGGLRLRERLEKLLSLRVAVLNDVQAMALGEQRFGVGSEGKDVLYVAVGTGVGGAMTRGGELVLGAHGFAGDIGHVLVDASGAGRRCPCGRRGHLEAYVSGAVPGYKLRTAWRGWCDWRRSAPNRRTGNCR